MLSGELVNLSFSYSALSYLSTQLSSSVTIANKSDVRRGEEIVTQQAFRSLGSRTYLRRTVCASRVLVATLLVTFLLQPYFLDEAFKHTIEVRCSMISIRIFDTNLTI